VRSNSGRRSVPTKSRKDIHNKLYEDSKAKQANQMKKMKQTLAEYNKDNFKASQLNDTSKKYYINKFTKEIIGIWTDLTSKYIPDEDKNNETMSQTVMLLMLQKLGFAVKNENEQDKNHNSSIKDFGQK
jgi:hypothetical protein